MQSILQQIAKLNEQLNQAFSMLRKITAKETKPPKTLSEYASDLIGLDASPENRATPELACAETVSYVCRYLVPNFPTILSTYELNKYLKARYKQEKVPRPDLVLVSPTGMGNGQIKNGHTGIVGKDSIIYSNNSNTGKLDKHWSIYTWAKYYALVGKYPMYYYDLTQPL